MKASELIVEILDEYGVSKIFGNPGTTELPIIDSVDKSSNLDYIMTFHEDVATGAAAGYSSKKRFDVDGEDINKSLSAVSLHVTPGLAHGLGNLYGAYYAGSPVIVTTGSQRDEVNKRNPPLSGDRVKLAEDYTKWSKRVQCVKDIPSDFRKAARMALRPPTGPVFLDIPMSIQNEKTNADVIPLGDIPRASSPEDSDVEPVVDILSESENPVIVVGNSVAHEGREATKSLVSIAERVGARMHGEVLFSHVSVPTSHPLWAGTLGLYQEDIEPVLDTDTVQYVGCETENPVFADKINSVISDDTTTAHIGYTTESIGEYHSGPYLTGSLSESLSKICNRLENEGINRDNTESVRSFIESIDEQRKNSVPKSDNRLSSIEVADAINSAIGDNILVEEAVTAGFVLRNTADLNYGQLIAQRSGGLGYGLPASIGVAIAEEEKQNSKNVLCYLGDGSYQYYPQSVYTAQRYVDESLTFLVAENGGYEILRSAEVTDDKSPTTDESLTFDSQEGIIKSAESYGLNAHIYQGNDLSSVIEDMVQENTVSLLEVPIAF
jgi:benzoylformate decarboxylase